METYKDFIAKKDRQWRKELNDVDYRGIPMKDIGRKGKHYFRREAWTFMPQGNLPEKVFVIERLKKICIEGTASHEKASQIGDVEYRIGYYMVGKIGRMHGRWTWGQYCPIIPQSDFQKLFSKARKEKTIVV